jgi:hypothetical protein
MEHLSGASYGAYGVSSMPLPLGLPSRLGLPVTNTLAHFALLDMLKKIVW